MRKRLSILALVVFGAAALTGCAGTRSNTLTYNPGTFHAPDPIPVSQLTTEYRLGIGDVVTVRVFNVDTLSGDQQVDPAGNITMPLIGVVSAIGHTTQELSADLVSRLGSRYLNSPQVQVTIKTVVPQTVTVDGSVTQPGVFTVSGRQTLLQTIAAARGVSADANPRRVVVFRTINGQRQAAGFDLTTIRRGTDPDPLIYPNDVVVVDGNQTSRTLRATLQTIPILGLFTTILRSGF